MVWHMQQVLRLKITTGFSDTIFVTLSMISSIGLRTREREADVLFRMAAFEPDWAFFSDQTFSDQNAISANESLWGKCCIESANVGVCLLGKQWSV